jgi:hypothetical protein
VSGSSASESSIAASAILGPVAASSSKKRARDTEGSAKQAHVDDNFTIEWGVIRFGAYIGFMPAVDRPEYARIAGIAESEDRIKSYLEGCAPKLYPSLDKVQYFPKRFENFPKLLAAYAAKTDPAHPGLTTRVVKSTGAVVSHMVPVPDPNYVPPPLTLTGQRLLGLVPYE